MRSFFLALDRRRVRYLLISGQASVLYGAATFSEDIDLWVQPRAENLTSFRQALADTGARIYKLTPPLRPDLARRGHDFHFLVPGAGGPAFVDVMGQPPRVGRFPAASRRRSDLETPWGTLPVLAIRDLVELKLTRRLADYQVVSNLVRVASRDRSAPPRATPRGLTSWALRRMFEPEGLLELLATLPAARAAARRLDRPALAPLLTGRGDPDLAACQRLLAAEISERQDADRRYWRPIVAELSELRRTGDLLPEGEPVAGR